MLMERLSQVPLYPPNEDQISFARSHLLDSCRAVGVILGKLMSGDADTTRLKLHVLLQLTAG